MKKYAFLIGILFIPAVLRAQDAATAGVNFVNFNPLEVFPVNKWGAYNSDDDPLALVDQSPDSLNVVTDDGPGLTGRKGFVSLSTEPLKAMWVLPHSSGTRYKLGQSSGMLKASLDGITYDITVSTVDSQYTTAGAVVGDTFYFSDLTNGLKSATFSGSVPTVVSVSTSLKFSMLIAAQGRLMGAGIPGSERILRISEYTPNEDNFTLVANSSDTMPAAITIPGALDEPISGLYSSYRGYPVVFKPHSFGILYGTRRSNFGYQKYSDQVGTAYPESVQDCDGLLRWLGPSRTIWEFNGVGWKDISNDPKNRKRISAFMATMMQGDARSRYFSWDTQTDFAAGNSLFVSTQMLSGSILLSTWTAIDTNSSDFAQGTLVNISTSLYANSITITNLGDTDISNHDFESGDVGATPASWRSNSSEFKKLAYDSSVSVYAGSYYVRMSIIPGYDTLYKYIIPAADVASLPSVSGALWSGTDNLSPYNTWRTCSINTSGVRGSYVRLVLKWGVDTTYIYSDPFYASDTEMTGHFYRRDTGADYIYFDAFYSGSATNTSGVFTSRTFDTGVTSPSWKATSASYDLNGGAISLFTRSSSDGIVWDSSVSWTSSQSPVSASKQFIQWGSYLSLTATSIGIPILDDATLSAIQSTGSWISNSIPIGSTSTFSTFVENSTTDGGSIVYAIYTDSDSTKTIVNGVPVVGTYLSSQTISNGSTPALSTSPYVFIGANLSVTVSTQNPKINSINFQWSEGSLLRVASAFPNKRYWLSVAVSSTANNRVLVYDKNEDWQLYSGINADAMIFDSELYFSNRSGVFQGETGYNDNGAAITSYYKTPTLALGGLDNWVKFHSLRLTTAQSDSTLSTTYQFNGDGTDYSFGSYAMNQATGYQNFKLPFPTSEVSQGKFLNLKFSVTGTAYWRILNASIYHRKDLLPR